MWSDIDFKQRVLAVRRAVRVTSGVVSIAEPKHGSHRLLPLSAEAIEVLREVPHKSIYVFPNAVGKPWDHNGFSLALKKFMSGLPSQIPRLTAHELRHTCGTAMRRRGVDIYAIQKFLGHRDIDVTANTYVHNEVETLRISARIDHEATTKIRQKG